MVSANPNQQSISDENAERLLQLLGEVKKLAKEYRQLTGRHLGVTGEIAEYEAARLLGLTLYPVRQRGCDAYCMENDQTVKVQIKGRSLDKGLYGALSRIDPKSDWDRVVLVRMDRDYEPVEIYQADRAVVVPAIERPGSATRNVRFQLPISTFVGVSTKVWSR
jgi:hypothetical protein